jgi:hypothetical protein
MSALGQKRTLGERAMRLFVVAAISGIDSSVNLGSPLFLTESGRRSSKGLFHGF